MSKYTFTLVYSVLQIYFMGFYLWASRIAQLVKNSPAMQETPSQFLGQEDPPEKGWATHCSTLGLPL